MSSRFIIWLQKKIGFGRDVITQAEHIKKMLSLSLNSHSGYVLISRKKLNLIMCERPSNLVKANLCSTIYEESSGSWCHSWCTNNNYVRMYSTYVPNFCCVKLLFLLITHHTLRSKFSKGAQRNLTANITL